MVSDSEPAGESNQNSDTSWRHGPETNVDVATLAT